MYKATSQINKQTLRLVHYLFHRYSAFWYMCIYIYISLMWWIAYLELIKPVEDTILIIASYHHSGYILVVAAEYPVFRGRILVQSSLRSNSLSGAVRLYHYKRKRHFFVVL